MNFVGFTSFTAIAILLFLTQQSNGLEISLCLGDAIGNGCQSFRSTNQYTTSLARIPLNSKIANARLALQNGFSRYNNSMSDTENILANAILSARPFLPTQPQRAAQIVKTALDDAMEMTFNSSSSLYLNIADASNYTDGTAKQGLITSIQMLQTVVLELIDQLRSSSFLTDEMISFGGNSSIQGINVILRTARSKFAALYLTADLSFKQAYVSVSNARGPPPVLGRNQNAAKAAKDPDAVAAAVQINTAATATSRRGVSFAKVDLLRRLFVRSVSDMAQVADHVRTYFTYITRVAVTDPYAAQSIYLAEAKGVCNRIQAIVANFCLDIGSAGFRASESTRIQVRSSIKALLRGNDNMVIGNKIARHLTLFGLKFAGKERSMSLNSAAESGRFAKIVMNEAMVRAARRAFNSM